MIVFTRYLDALKRAWYWDRDECGWHHFTATHDMIRKWQPIEDEV